MTVHPAILQPSRSTSRGLPVHKARSPPIRLTGFREPGFPHRRGFVSGSGYPSKPLAASQPLAPSQRFGRCTGLPSAQGLHAAPLDYLGVSSAGASHRRNGNGCQGSITGDPPISGESAVSVIRRCRGLAHCRSAVLHSCHPFGHPFDHPFDHSFGHRYSVVDSPVSSTSRKFSAPPGHPTSGGCAAFRVMCQTVKSGRAAGTVSDSPDTRYTFSDALRAVLAASQPNRRATPPGEPYRPVQPTREPLGGDAARKCPAYLYSGARRRVVPVRSAAPPSGTGSKER